MNRSEQSELFLSVVHAHKGIIYKVVNSYCKNPEDREDLVQEIIIQLWKSFGQYDDSFKHSTWMYRIALNVAISFYRKESSRKRISNPMTEGIINFPEQDDFNDTETEVGMLRSMIAQLKDLDKALILLYLDEKNHKEISRIMGISETNVATKINRIKNHLKRKFAQLKKN